MHVMRVAKRLHSYREGMSIRRVFMSTIIIVARREMPDGLSVVLLHKIHLIVSGFFDG